MTYFDFTVRRLRPLARVPLLPQLFDAMLLAWTALWHRDRLRAMEAIEAAALDQGFRLTVHKFGGIGFSRDGHEVAHLHGNGLLDAHLGSKLAGELVTAKRAEPHHLFGKSAWVSYWVRSAQDVTKAAELLRLAA